MTKRKNALPMLLSTGVVTLVAFGPAQAYQAAAPGLALADAAPAASVIQAEPVKPALPGSKPIETGRLANSRGGADVLNDMKLKGVVADNQASNLSTGNNLISDGALSGASGMPMVIQNSGNNVLIQNATIVNVQVK
jgi:hypothetical protein